MAKAAEVYNAFLIGLPEYHVDIKTSAVHKLFLTLSFHVRILKESWIGGGLASSLASSGGGFQFKLIEHVEKELQSMAQSIEMELESAWLPTASPFELIIEAISQQVACRSRAEGVNSRDSLGERSLIAYALPMRI